MERQSPEKITVKSSMYHATFCIKYKTTGPPRGALGDYPLLSMNDECHTYECTITFDFLSGTGFDQSARGLAALYYVGATGCWTSSVPAPKPSLSISRSSQSDCPAGKS